MPTDTRLSPDKFINRVRQTLRTHAMIPPGNRILVGLSGGPDSVALVRVLMALAGEFNLSIVLAHLNHNLRGKESLRDERFVRDFAETHSLPLTVDTLDIKAAAKAERLSLEEAGRNARYAFFKRTAVSEGCHRIALGHNKDDHVEQVLMNLIRGAGVQGLRGIAPVREDVIIRPFITLSKTDILSYLEDICQNYIVDSSNRDTVFLRNRVRHNLIPMLEEEFNPNIRSGLDRLSRILSIEDDYMDARAEELYNRLQNDGTGKLESNSIRLALDGFASCHSALAFRVIRKALGAVKKDLRRITHTHIMDILTLARSGETGKHLDLPGQIRVYKEKQMLRI
ncbi:MAG: tRNA lysidine(34) synthetase TilS, partial [Desulfobacterales bacterium]|nr:tRNA lysidine(34) synthetase TilS [Desulfobacterales bacterium]